MVSSPQHKAHGVSIAAGSTISYRGVQNPTPREKEGQFYQDSDIETSK